LWWKRSPWKFVQSCFRSIELSRNSTSTRPRSSTGLHTEWNI
jgi:hypothetical protein